TCSGNMVNFTATAVNGGSNPSYKWEVNGVNQSTNNTVFSTGSLANGDTVKCILTSNAGCLSSPSTVSSNTIVMNVGVQGNAGAISATRDTICSGTPGYLFSTGATGNLFRWQEGANTSSFANIKDADTIFYRTGPLNSSAYYRLIAGSGVCADTSGNLKLT